MEKESVSSLLKLYPPFENLGSSNSSSMSSTSSSNASSQVLFCPEPLTLPDLSEFDATNVIVISFLRFQIHDCLQCSFLMMLRRGRMIYSVTIVEYQTRSHSIESVTVFT